MFGSERPGHVHPDRKMLTTPRGPLVAHMVVDEWIKTMLEKGMKVRVRVQGQG